MRSDRSIRADDGRNAAEYRPPRPGFMAKRCVPDAFSPPPTREKALRGGWNRKGTGLLNELCRAKRTPKFQSNCSFGLVKVDLVHRPNCVDASSKTAPVVSLASHFKAGSQTRADQIDHHEEREIARNRQVVQR